MVPRHHLDIMNHKKGGTTYAQVHSYAYGLIGLLNVQWLLHEEARARGDHLTLYVGSEPSGRGDPS